MSVRLAGATAPKTGRLTLKSAFLLAGPHTWGPISIYSCAFALLWCGARVKMDPAVCAALAAVCLLMHSSVNALDDYFDLMRGTDRPEDNVEAYDALLLHTELSPRWALYVGISYLTAGAVVGLWVVWRTSLTTLVFGVAGGAILVLYTAGTLPLSHLPVGEIVSGVTIGGLLPQGVASAFGLATWDLFFYSTPLIVGVALVMMTNNICDIERDSAAGRWTLPVLLGRPKARSIYRALAMLWVFVVCALAYLQTTNVALLLIPSVALAAGAPKYFALMNSELRHEDRVRAMGAVIASNFTVNGAYLLATAGSTFGW
jgi:1,4-dihydroxy-2-naphthoate octaprenyltransferase